MNAIIEYLKHDSTWKGIFALLTAVGITLDPAQSAAIMAAGMAAIGLIQVFITDRNVTK